jgi:hypothetical protein
VADTSTLPEPREPAEIKRARDWRRAGLVLLVLFVIAGAIGVFGTRTSEAAASAGGYTVTVTYPKASRPGHAVRYEVEVKHPGGFDGPIRMRLLSSYFDLFDENSFNPDPDTSTTNGDYDLYEFTPPGGDTFVLSSDTRVEPARQRGEAGEVSVLDGSGRPVVTVRYQTRIFP